MKNLKFNKVILFLSIFSFSFLWIKIPTSIGFSGERNSDIRIANNGDYSSVLNITWGGINGDYGRDIAVDTSGNIYMTGITWSSGAGGADVFIAKFDNAGNSLFNVTWGGIFYDSGIGIVLDNTNNIYIVGDTVSFGPGGLDVFIAKFDSAGNSLLNITWGGIYDETGHDITLDDLGNIYITGDTWSFGSGAPDAFIAKFNSNGDSTLNITWGGSTFDNDFGEAIVLDDLGNIYMTGWTDSFGAGSNDAFVAKFNGNGDSIFNITWGDSNSDIGKDIILDNFGNIYITGDTKSFGGANDDVFIAKYSNSGNSIYNRTWGGAWNQYGRAIEADSLGNAYITGSTRGLGSDNEAFIAKYDSLGNQIMNITWGGSNDDDGFSIFLDNSKNIFITGETESFGVTGKNAFIAKYDSPYDEGTNNDTPLNDDPSFPPELIILFIFLILLGILSAVILIKQSGRKKTGISLIQKSSKSKPIKTKNKDKKRGFSKIRRQKNETLLPAQPENVYYASKNQVDNKLLNFIRNQKKSEGVIKKANLPAIFKEKYDLVEFKIIGLEIIITGIKKENM